MQVIARFLGWAPAPAAATEALAAALAAAPPPGLVVARAGECDMPPPLFDAAALRARNRARALQIARRNEVMHG